MTKQLVKVTVKARYWLDNSDRAVARAFIGGGGGYMLIFSCYARLISFEINLILGITWKYEYSHPQLTL